MCPARWYVPLGALVRRMRSLMKIIKGLAALTVLLGLVAGVPIALFALAGNPLERLPEVLQLLSRPDYGGIIFFSTILPIIGWALWAFFTLSVALEIPSAVRGIKAPRIKGLGSMQGVAATLLGSRDRTLRRCRPRQRCHLRYQQPEITHRHHCRRSRQGDIPPTRRKPPRPRRKPTHRRPSPTSWSPVTLSGAWQKSTSVMA